MTRQGVTVLGATGSIGQSTLDVIRRHPERYRVVALTAHRQVERLVADCIEFKPQLAVVGDARTAAQVEERLAAAACRCDVAWGTEALVTAATLPDADMVMAAIVGAAGLEPTLAAARAGKRILLANKEVLVMAGELFMHAVQTHGATLLPVDSEHNAIFQSLPADFARGLAACGVQKILLTASGGPFRSKALSELAHVTPEQACAHPNWVMGRKISVDSATMMNKGLDHLGCRIEQPARLDDYAPDFERFRCLQLAYDVLHAGGTAPAILNAANEVAVAAFLDGQLPFLGIARLNDSVLQSLATGPEGSLADVVAADAEARHLATGLIRERRFA